jgi:BolA protein
MNAHVNANKIKRMRELLTHALTPSHLIILDDSHKHKGHANEGAGHFRIEIISGEFIGKPRIEQHRLVYQALSPMIPKEIHALSIASSSPDKE